MKVKEKSGSNEIQQQREILAIQSATGATPELISSLAKNAFEKYITRYNKFMNEEEPKAALKISAEEHLRAKSELQLLTPDKIKRDQEDNSRKEKKEKGEIVPEFTQAENDQRANFDRKYAQADGDFTRARMNNEKFLPESMEGILALIILECGEAVQASKETNTPLKLAPEDTKQSNALIKAVKGNLQSKADKNQHDDDNDIINSLRASKYVAARDIVQGLSKNLLLTPEKKRAQSWNTVRASIKESRDSALLAAKKPDVQAYSDTEFKYSRTPAMDKDAVRRREDSVGHLSKMVIELRQYVGQFYKFALAGEDKINIVKTEAVLEHMNQQLAAFEEMPEIFKRKLEKVIDGYKGLEKELRSAVLDYKQAQQGSEVIQSAVAEKSPEKSSPRGQQKTNVEAQPQQPEQGSPKGPNVGWVQARMKEKDQVKTQEQGSKSTHHESVVTMGRK